jgi:hypothetical protein
VGAGNRSLSASLSEPASITAWARVRKASSGGGGGVPGLGRHVAIERTWPPSGRPRRPRWGLRMLAVVGLLVLAVALAGILVVGRAGRTRLAAADDDDLAAPPGGTWTVPVGGPGGLCRWSGRRWPTIQGQDVARRPVASGWWSARWIPAGDGSRGLAVLPPDRAPETCGSRDSSAVDPADHHWRLQRGASLALHRRWCWGPARRPSVALGVGPRSPPTWSAGSRLGRRAVGSAAGHRPGRRQHSQP